MLTYVLSGLCAAIGGHYRGGGYSRCRCQQTPGLWLELDAILAVVIGGGSLMGGRFNLLLSVVGALIIQGMNTGILLSGFSAGDEPGRKSGGGALCADCSVATLYQSD